MARLIDADDLKKSIKSVLKEKGFNAETIAVVCRVVNTQHTIESVKHGKWEEYGYKWRCSCCHIRINLRGTLPEENGLHYCPNCGARMDGE